jgi:hypothetical protein
MTVRLIHTAWGAAQQSVGIEIDDDGHARSWQTSGHRVGRFARELSASERTALERALSAARDADSQATPDPAGRVLPPSGSREQLVADGLSGLELDGHAEPPTGFGDLVNLLVKLREDLAESPLAAIELEVDGAPLAARLRHVGSEPVSLRLGALTLSATLFGKGSALVDSVTHTVDPHAVDGPVGPGWVLPLVEDVGLAGPRKGGFLTVTVGTAEVDSLGDGVLRSAEFSWIAE